MGGAGCFVRAGLRDGVYAHNRTFQSAAAFPQIIVFKRDKVGLSARLTQTTWMKAKCRQHKAFESFAQRKEGDGGPSHRGRFLFQFQFTLFAVKTGNTNSSLSTAFLVAASLPKVSAPQTNEQAHTSFLSGRKWRAERGRELISKVEVL